MTPITLTPAIIKALRSCRTIVVSSHLNEYCRPTGARVVVKNDEDPKFVPLSWEDVEAYSEYYNGFDNVKRFERGRCSHVMFLYPEQVTHLGSIFQILKSGDEIYFTWGIGGGTSELLEANDMVGDSILLGVRRGKKRLQFRLESITCEANSTARMIRPR